MLCILKLIHCTVSANGEIGFKRDIEGKWFLRLLAADVALEDLNFYDENDHIFAAIRNKHGEAK